MIILIGVVLLLAGAALIARSTRRRPGRHRAEAEWARLRPAHARPRSVPRPATLDPARPHRLVAQDAALSRR
jgi:hypothetical protein